MLEELQIADIIRGPETQVRKELDAETVKRYAELMKEKGGRDQFPPCDVFRDVDGKVWMSSGHHRTESALEAGYTTILASVHEGDLRDARWFAATANGKNGLPYSRADIRTAIGKLVADWPERSSHVIAKAIGCSHQTVIRVKNELVQMDQLKVPEKTIGKDGKEYPAKKEEKQVTQMSNLTPDESDQSQPATLKVDPFNSPGPTPTPTRPAIYEEPEEEQYPIADPILRANEKAVSIIASIHMLGRQISDYCDIAPEECIDDAMNRFIQACLGLFDNADVERVIKNMKRGAA